MIYEDLQELKLNYLSEHYDDFVTQVTKSALSPKEIINKIVDLELLEKRNRNISRKIRDSKIGKFKKMEDFDWDHPESIEKGKIEELLTSEFVKDHINLILGGPQGSGKTMIAKNIAWNSVMNGHSALLTTASSLVIDLGSQDTSAALRRRLKKYEHPDLLVIDEIGYLSYDCKSADLLFEVINRRYEKGSIVLTTNLGFKDWHKIFPGASCLTALIDRFTHHCEVIKIVADSYRSKEAAKRGKLNAKK